MTYLINIMGFYSHLNSLSYHRHHNNDIKQMDEIFARMFEVKNGKILKIDIK